MTATDRRLGVSGSAAFKLPCRVATTANITLSGLQTVDGVALAADDRVLVKNQTTGSENGIYVADTSTWQRAVDFNGPRDCVQGTLVMVAAGSTQSSTVFQLSTASPVIGTSSLTFVVTGSTALALASAFMLTVLDDTTAAAARTTLGAAATTDLADYIAKAFFAAKGDILTASGNDTPALLTVGANGTIPMARSAATAGLAYVAALYSAIYGLTYANNAGDATNDLDIAAGGCMDATGAYWITVAALTKQSDVNWAVGTNAGALDTGSVGNSDYYIWAIARSDTGVNDILFSLSSTAPTMPANYDYKRLIGWFKRSGATIVAFKTYETAGGGLELRWNVPTLDVNLANTLTTSRRTDAVKVPLNIVTEALLTVSVYDATGQYDVRIMCPDETDAAVIYTSAPLSNASSSTNTPASQSMRVRTSSAGLIAARASLATVDVYNVSTVGFVWSRR